MLVRTDCTTAPAHLKETQHATNKNKIQASTPLGIAFGCKPRWYYWPEMILNKKPEQTVLVWKLPGSYMWYCVCGCGRLVNLMIRCVFCIILYGYLFSVCPISVFTCCQTWPRGKVTWQYALPVDKHHYRWLLLLCSHLNNRLDHTCWHSYLNTSWRHHNQVSLRKFSGP